MDVQSSMGLYDNDPYRDVFVYITISGTEQEYERAVTYDTEQDQFFEGAWRYSPNKTSAFADVETVPNEVVVEFKRRRPEAEKMGKP